MFQLFGKKSRPADRAGSPAVRKHAERVANKRAQAVDRWEAIRALVAMRTEEAVEALLPRFTFYVEPSITDQEEKDLAFEGIIDAGKCAIGPVTEFLHGADSISWPVKMLDQLASPEEVTGILIGLLDEMDIEYERDPQRKIQVLSALEERVDGRILGAVPRFFEDANETVRFTAVGAVLAQPEADAAKGGLIDCLCEEESVRVRNRILRGFVDRGWDLSGRSEEVKPKLTSGFALDAKGVLHGPR